MENTLSKPEAESQIAGLVVALLLLDPQMRIAEINYTGEILFGRSSKKIVGQKLFELLTLHDERLVDRISASQEQLIARGVSIEIAELRRDVNFTVSPVANHPGWQVLTISEVKPNESEDDDASEAAELRAPAILAHEIKNPLSAIRGAAQLLARKIDARDRPLARMIHEEVDRIARLVDRMQQLGSRNVDPVTPLNLHESVRAAMATVRAAGVEGVELVEEFDPSLPRVLANADALEQVLINLISNARDAAALSEEPRVVVKTRFVSGLVFNAIRLGKSVRLPIEVTITDNGPGIDPSIQKHIFEPFVTTKKSGQGLGLALVRKLVRDMSGRIHHERCDNVGLTHFRIHLPVAK